MSNYTRRPLGSKTYGKPRFENPVKKSKWVEFVNADDSFADFVSKPGRSKKSKKPCIDVFEIQSDVSLSLNENLKGSCENIDQKNGQTKRKKCYDVETSQFVDGRSVKVTVDEISRKSNEEHDFVMPNRKLKLKNAGKRPDESIILKSAKSRCWNGLDNIVNENRKTPSENVEQTQRKKFHDVENDYEFVDDRSAKDIVEELFRKCNEKPSDDFVMPNRKLKLKTAKKPVIVATRCDDRVQDDDWLNGTMKLSSGLPRAEKLSSQTSDNLDKFPFKAEDDISWQKIYQPVVVVRKYVNQVPNVTKSFAEGSALNGSHHDAKEDNSVCVQPHQDLQPEPRNVPKTSSCDHLSVAELQESVLPVISTPIVKNASIPVNKNYRLSRFGKNKVDVGKCNMSPILMVSNKTQRLLKSVSIENSLNGDKIIDGQSWPLNGTIDLSSGSMLLVEERDDFVKSQESVLIGKSLSRISLCYKKVNDINCGEHNLSLMFSGLSSSEKKPSITDDILRLCNQDAILSFSDVFPKRLSSLSTKKIGEGAFSEVFKTVINKESIVMKIIPVSESHSPSDENITLPGVLSEMVVSKALSDLREANFNSCPTFVKVLQMHLVRGRYPNVFQNAWKRYDDEIQSENRNPSTFPNHQLFTIIVFENGGLNLDNFKISSLKEIVSIRNQISCSMAVAEQALEFEHRDLHCGNILVSRTNCTTISYVINGVPVHIDTSGILITIIDYNLSRMMQNEVTTFTNLAESEDFFTGKGDSQYDVYREMRIINKNDWSCYHPETNVLWLAYVLKTITSHFTGSKRKCIPDVTLLEMNSIESMLKNCCSMFDFINKLKLLA